MREIVNAALTDLQRDRLTDPRLTATVKAFTSDSERDPRKHSTVLIDRFRRHALELITPDTNVNDCENIKHVIELLAGKLSESYTLALSRMYYNMCKRLNTDAECAYYEAANALFFDTIVTAVNWYSIAADLIEEALPAEAVAQQGKSTE